MENPLLELQEYENLQEALKKAKGPVQATGTLDSQKVHLMLNISLKEMLIHVLENTLTLLMVYSLLMKSKHK